MRTVETAAFVELDRIASTASMTLCISSTPDLAAFDISDISGGPSISEWASGLSQHGQVFVGIITLKDGSAKARLVEPLEQPVIEMLTAATLSHIARRYLHSLNSLGLAALRANGEMVN